MCICVKYVLYVLSMCCMCISVNVDFKSVFKNEIYFQLHVPVCSCTFWCFVGDVPFYIVRNSWGTDFGNNGYLYIKYGENVCGKNSFFGGGTF